MSPVAEHMAHRPSWDCLACGKPWPCDPAREAMVRDMDEVQLRMFMWTQLEAAAGDLPPGSPPAETFERFMSWARPGDPGE